MRFVTGKLRKKGYEVRTPVAAIGIRGTDLIVLVESDGTTTIWVLEGSVAVLVLGSGQSVVAVPGRAVRVLPDGTVLRPDPNLASIPVDAALAVSAAARQSFASATAPAAASSGAVHGISFHVGRVVGGGAASKINDFEVEIANAFDLERGLDFVTSEDDANVLGIDYRRHGERRGSWQPFLALELTYTDGAEAVFDGFHVPPFDPFIDRHEIKTVGLGIMGGIRHFPSGWSRTALVGGIGLHFVTSTTDATTRIFSETDGSLLETFSESADHSYTTPVLMIGIETEAGRRGEWLFGFHLSAERVEAEVAPLADLTDPVFDDTEVSARLAVIYLFKGP